MVQGNDNGKKNEHQYNDSDVDLPDMEKIKLRSVSPVSRPQNAKHMAVGNESSEFNVGDNVYVDTSTHDLYGPHADDNKQGGHFPVFSPSGGDDDDARTDIVDIIFDENNDTLHRQSVKRDNV